MDAQKTIKYLYEHGHIPNYEHYITITDELGKIKRLRDILREIAEDAQEILESIDKIANETV